MSEMSHVKVAENLERLANDFEEVGSPGNAKTLRSAATDECRITNEELVEVVKCGECKHWERQHIGLYPKCVKHQFVAISTFSCADGERKDGTK